MAEQSGSVLAVLMGQNWLGDALTCPLVAISFAA